MDDNGARIMVLHIGEMRHRVQIQERSSTPTATGEPASTWTTLATVPSTFEPSLMGSVIVDASQRQGRLPVKFRCRYVQGLTIRPRMRVVFGDRWFDITSVAEVSPRHEVVIVAEELVERAL